MILQVLMLALPWGIRRKMMNILLGWEIAPNAWIGKSIILAKKLRMGPNSRIHNFVFCKKIDLLELEEDSGIAAFTYITGFSTKRHKIFAHRVDRRCELKLGAHAGITSRHYVDCNGGIYIGEYSTIAGIRSQLLTHSIDVYNNRQDAKPIIIGKYCFIGTGCILLPGCSLPDYSILGAGSVLTKAYDRPGMLYAGSPAREIKSLDVPNIPYFHREKHVVD